MHSRCWRQLADTAITGREVVVLRVRRLRRSNGQKGTARGGAGHYRWPLWSTLGDAVERTVLRHRRHLAAAPDLDDTPTAGKIERGQRSLRLETIVKIADGLDIHAGRLVSG